MNPAVSCSTRRALVLATIVIATTSTTAAAVVGETPNFVIINIDDLGYADIGPFGSTLNRTPHLDRMAKEGRLLTSHYAAPVCSPSRSSLMTGCYPKRVLPIAGVLFPAGSVGLNPDEVTIAEVMAKPKRKTQSRQLRSPCPRSNFTIWKRISRNPTTSRERILTLSLNFLLWRMPWRPIWALKKPDLVVELWDASKMRYP